VDGIQRLNTPTGPVPVVNRFENYHGDPVDEQEPTGPVPVVNSFENYHTLRDKIARGGAEFPNLLPPARGRWGGWC